MNEKQRLNWEKERAKGRKTFIWLYGILGWGVTMAISFSFVKPWVGNEPLSAVQILLSFTLFPLGGIILGLLVWKQKEKRYEKAIDKNV